MYLRRLLVIITVAALAGCTTDSVETPRDALLTIARLYEARDFDTLIRTRYAEIDKAENDDQIRSLVDRFVLRFESAAELTRVITLYRHLAETEPELSDGGRIATFRFEGGFLKLSRMPDGRWGFHL